MCAVHLIKRNVLIHYVHEAGQPEKRGPRLTLAFLTYLHSCLTQSRNKHDVDQCPGVLIRSKFSTNP